MNKKYLLSMLAIAIASTSSAALAAGFQLNAQSATGLGRAFAGDAVIADNAAVMARNSAAMALFDSPQLSLGLIGIDSDVQVKNATYDPFLAPAPSALADTQAGGLSFAPNLFYVHPINPTLTLGVGVYSNFGTKTEFDENYLANELGGLTDVKSVNLAFSAALRATEHLSVGVGLDIIYGTGKLQRYGLDQIGAVLPPLASSLGQNMLNLDAAGVGIGWNVGAVYEINALNRFGFSYRHSPEIRADGDTMIYKGQPLGAKLLLTLPDMAEFSGFHQLMPQFALHYSVQWIGWRDFDTLSTTNGTELNSYLWQDGWHFSLGGTYTINNQWQVRAGYMYDTSAQDQKRSISVPDSNRQWFSAGVSYQLGQHSTIDFGLTYLLGHDVAVDDVLTTSIGGNEVAISNISATTRANAWLYGLQYSYKF